MKTPNFIIIFKSLNTREVTAFSQYLHSFLPADSIPAKVLEYFGEGDLEDQLDQLKEEEKLVQIFPGNKNPSKSLSNTLSDLQKYLEDFLVSQKLLKDKKDLREQLLLEVFQEKKLEQFADSLFDKSIKAFEKKEGKDEADYLHAMRLYEFHFYNSRTPKLDPKTGIEKCMEYLELFFVTNKFKFAAEMRNRETFIKENYDIHFLKEAETFLRKYRIEDTPAGTLFYLAFKFNEKAIEETYRTLKEKLFLFIDQLSKTDKNILMGYLLNYTAREIRKGKSGILKESLELHQKGVEQRLFISDGYFPPGKFTNILELAAVLKQFDWAETFIRKWQAYLPKAIKKAVILVCQNIILFEKGVYGEVLTALAVFKHRDVFLNLRVKSLVIRGLYERHVEVEAILAQCHSFEVYLSRKKIAHEDVIRSCKNFIKIVRRLLHRNAKRDKAKLLKELEGIDKIAYKTWLKDKIKDV